MPYTPSVISATFLATLASYQADLGYPALQAGGVPTTPMRAMADALAVYFGLIGGGPVPPGPWAVSPKAAAFLASVWTWYRVDASGGGVAVTLPSGAANVGKMIGIKKTDATGNAVSWVLFGAETTDAPSLIKQGETAWLMGHSGGWDIT